MYKEFTSITEEESKEYIQNSINQRVRGRIAELATGYVLDVGCANGIDAQRYNPNNYLGVDISPELIKTAIKRNPHHFFICDNALEFLDRDIHFDFIICKAVLEHIPLDKAISLYHKMVEKSDVLLLAWHMIPADKTEIHQIKGHFGKDILQNEYDFKLFSGYNIKKEVIDNYELWIVTK